MSRIYKEFKKLSHIPPGFAWDPNTKTGTTPKDVWDEHIKVLYLIFNCHKSMCSNLITHLLTHARYSTSTDQ